MRFRSSAVLSKPGLSSRLLMLGVLTAPTALAQPAPDDAPAETPPATEPPAAPEEPPAEEPEPPPEAEEPAPPADEPPQVEGQPEPRDPGEQAPPPSEPAEAQVEEAPPTEAEPTPEPPAEEEPVAAPEVAPAEQEAEVVVGDPPPVNSERAAADGAAVDPEEVVLVAGTRSAQMAGAVQVIGQKQLERTEYDDPHAVLRQVPGVYVREEDGTGLRPNVAMRGVNPDRSKKVTLMEDGVLFGPAPYSAPAAYYFPMMTRMTQVRVIKGPGAVAYGPQTVAGAIDFITRRVPYEPTVGVDLAYGQYGYRKVHAHAGTSNEQFGVLFEGVHVGNDGFKELPDDANTGSARNEWMAKAFYVVDPTAAVNNEFSIKFTYSDEASNETYLGLTDADFDQNPDRRYPSSALDRMDNHRTGVALSHELKSYDDDVELRTTLYRNDFSRVWRKFNRLGGASASDVLADPDDPSNAAYYGVLAGEADTSGPLDTLYIGPNERYFVSQGLASRLSWAPKTGALSHRFEAGIRLHHDAIEREHSEDAFLMLGGELYPAQDQATLVTSSNHAQTHALALHVTDAITWKSLTVTPGVRFEGMILSYEDFLTGESAERTVVGVMPGLGVYYGIVPTWGLLAGAYRGFSPPAPGTDATTKPESSINYEAGTRFVHESTRAEVIGFFNDYSNLTDVCTFSSGCLDADLDRQFDAGKANIYGLEVLLAHDLEAGPVTFPLSAAYTLSFGEFENDFSSADPIYGTVEKGDEIPYLPRHQASATVAFEVDRFAGYTVMNYVSALREEAGSEDLSVVMSADPVLTFDAGVSARVYKKIKLYLNGRNLADYRAIVSHRPFGARPNAPRWIQGGVTAEF